MFLQIMICVRARRKRGDVGVSVGSVKIEKNPSVHYCGIKIGLDMQTHFLVLSLLVISHYL
jgi:hypothetical protein